MRRVNIDDLEDRMGPADVARPLTDVLGLANAAINYYELAPGESFAYGFHAHEDQEEIFYIESGTVTFRTEGGEVNVGPRGAISFQPGEFQRGVNDGEERVRAIAIGAPQRSGETEIRRSCPQCAEETPHELSLAEDQSAVIAACKVCGTETGRFE